MPSYGTLRPALCPCTRHRKQWAILNSACAIARSSSFAVGCLQTDTPLTHKITSSEAALKASIAMHPLKRIGSADDPAALAELLLSPSSGNITGQIICVDGGLGSIKSQ
jgi:NAD(P)-dependent dehydrogenase (short-subunit alcohol dehydrogenase family)